MAWSESPIIVPQQTKLPLIKAEITVLKAHLEDWRTAKGKQPLHVLNAIHKEACLQALTWDKVILKARKKACTSTYKEWLYNQSRRKAPKPLIKYGKKWTETPGSEGMIVKWPEATKTVLAGLSAEEKEEAKVVADKWNNEAAPPEIQASVAESKGANMIEHFATEIFKQAGMRVFVMSAWQDSRGKLMLGAHDFNEQFGSGESFLKTRDWDGIFMPEWQQYAGDKFDVQDQDVPQIVTSKKRVPRKLLELEEDNDGWPMLPDTMGWKRGGSTAWMCMGSHQVKTTVPWGDLVKNQSNFFDSTYWPANVQLVEPSKMDKADITALLDFWHHRQQKKLHPTFCFKAWKDSDGDMEMPAKSFLKTLQRATQHAKDHGARQARRDTGHQYNDEQSTDGGEVEEEDRKSTDDDEERASIVSNDREEPLPPMPARSNMIRKSAVALKTPQAAPKSAGTNT
ncbi:hypothetical protein F4604DRAFT_1937241 [Suillus subluteus]|nr:hypothetical protein F4604DRAFT_1937241 [Suillus subluteus]